jgi:transcriptional regulator NrdR family protein
VANGPSCPACGERKSRVLKTTEHPLYPNLTRRRECLACGWRFTTDEKLAWEGQGHRDRPKPS